MNLGKSLIKITETKSYTENVVARYDTKWHIVVVEGEESDEEEGDYIPLISFCVGMKMRSELDAALISIFGK